MMLNYTKTKQILSFYVHTAQEESAADTVASHGPKTQTIAEIISRSLTILKPTHSDKQILSLPEHNDASFLHKFTSTSVQ